MADTTTEPQAPVAPAPAAAPASPPPAAPEAQVAPQAPATPEPGAPAAQEPRRAPRSEREARSASRDRSAQYAKETREAIEARKAAAEPAPEATPPAAPVEPVVEEAVRKRDPVTGQFLPGSEPTEEPAAATPSGKVPEGFVRIPLPEGDIRRSFGGQAFVEVPKNVEQGVRAAINGLARRNELEEVKRRNAELQEELIRRDATLSAEERFKKTPEYEAASRVYFSLLDGEQAGEYPEGTALDYWKSKASSLLPLIEEETQTRQNSITQERVQQEAQEWIGEAERRAQAVVPIEIRASPAFRRVFDAAVSAFAFEVSRGYQPEVVQDNEKAHAAFAEYLKHRVFADPELKPVLQELHARKQQRRPVVAAADAEAERARATQEAAASAVARFKQDVVATRVQAPPHPMGALARAGGPTPPASSAPPSKPEGNAPESAIRAQRSGAAAARALARRYTGSG